MVNMFSQKGNCEMILTDQLIENKGIYNINNLLVTPWPLFPELKSFNPYIAASPAYSFLLENVFIEDLNHHLQYPIILAMKINFS